MNAIGILKLISIMLLVMGLNQMWKENRYKSKYPNRGIVQQDSLIVVKLDSVLTNVQYDNHK